MALDLFSLAATAVLGGELLACKATATATGAVAVIAVVEGALILTSVASPLFFSGRSGDLSSLGGTIQGKVTDLQAQIEAFKNEWQGPAVEQLVYYWDRQVTPLLSALKPVCDGAAQVMSAMSTAEWTLIAGMVTATTGLLVTLVSGLAAAPVPGATHAIHWGAVAAFAAIIGAMVTALTAFCVSLANATNGIKASAAQIAEALYTDAQARTGSRLTVPAAVLPDLRSSIDEARSQYGKK